MIIEKLAVYTAIPSFIVIELTRWTHILRFVMLHEFWISHIQPDCIAEVDSGQPLMGNFHSAFAPYLYSQIGQDIWNDGENIIGENINDLENNHARDISSWGWQKALFFVEPFYIFQVWGNMPAGQNADPAIKNHLPAILCRWILLHCLAIFFDSKFIPARFFG